MNSGQEPRLRPEPGPVEKPAPAAPSRECPAWPRSGSPGRLFIMESILDSSRHRPQAGERIAEEKHGVMRLAIGLALGSLKNLECPAAEIPAGPEKRLSLEGKAGKPWRGVSSAFRPLRAFVSGKRESATFYVFPARVAA